MNSSVAVKLSIVAFPSVIENALRVQGYSFSAMVNDVNAELGKAGIRDVEQKTGSTRYAKKADETVTPGSVTFKGANSGTSTPLQFKAFADSIGKIAKQFPSMELGRDFTWPAQFQTWMDGKRTVKPANSGKPAKGAVKGAVKGADVQPAKVETVQPAK